MLEYQNFFVCNNNKTEQLAKILQLLYALENLVQEKYSSNLFLYLQVSLILHCKKNLYFLAPR